MAPSIIWNDSVVNGKVLHNEKQSVSLGHSEHHNPHNHKFGDVRPVALVFWYPNTTKEIWKTYEGLGKCTQILTQGYLMVKLSWKILFKTNVFVWSFKKKTKKKTAQMHLFFQLWFSAPPGHSGPLDCWSELKHIPSYRGCSYWPLLWTPDSPGSVGPWKHCLHIFPAQMNQTTDLVLLVYSQVQIQGVLKVSLLCI